MLVPDDYTTGVLPPEGPLTDDVIAGFSPHEEDTAASFEYHFEGAQLASFKANQVRTELFARGFYTWDNDDSESAATRIQAPITGDVHLAFQEAAAVLHQGFAPKGAYETQARFDARLKRYIDDFHRPINRSIQHAELRAEFMSRDARAEALWADFRRLSPDIDRGPFSRLAKAARKGRSAARLKEVRLCRDQTRRFNPESAP